MDLERLGIVSRVQYDEMPVRVEYRLTEAGRSLVPILLAMRDWGTAYGERLAKLGRRTGGLTRGAGRLAEGGRGQARRTSP